MKTTYIGGSWIEPVGATISVENPADGSIVGKIGYGGAADATAACDAAADAFPAWAATSAHSRADLLRAAADQLASRAEPIGTLLAKETGKRLPEGIAEVGFAAEYFRWFSEELRHPSGQILAEEVAGRRQLALRRPVGVALCLSPWNFPVSIQARKLAAALAAGCSAVCRTSEHAPLAVVEMFRVLSEVGLPAGVANLVHGPAAEQTDAMLAHPAVRVVSFTGSTDVGRRVMALASARIVRPLLELGGDAPFVVLDDADVDAAVEGALIAKFRNNGQSCIAANRFIVQAGIADAFRERLVARIDAMVVGDPTGDPIPDLGPLIHAERVAAVRSVVEEAVAAGARRLTAEIKVPVSGSYLAPALFDSVPPEVRLGCAEVFGPVAGMFVVDSDDAALALANATEMGLAGYVYTRDAARSWRFIEQLQVGIVGCNSALPSAVNAPMGGVKQSGLGREGDHLGIEEFREIRYASWVP